MNDWKTLILPLATAIGAFGGFPTPPQEFQMLTRYEIFRWFVVFVLIWQGGGQQDLQLALLTTSIVYLVTKILDMRRTMNRIVTLSSTPPPPQMPMPPMPPMPPRPPMPPKSPNGPPVKEGFYY